MTNRLELLLANTPIESVFDHSDFSVVTEAANVGEVSFNHFDFLTDKSYTATTFFTGLVQSLSFIFPNFTISEIKSLSSTAYFYFDIFPFPQIMNDMHASNFKVHVLNRKDTVRVNFNLFTLSFRFKKWIFSFSDTFKKEQEMESISFVNIHTAMLRSFKELISDVMIKPPLLFDNAIFKKIIENKSNFSFNSMRYEDVFTHETDVNFSRHIKKIQPLMIVGDLRSIKGVAQPAMLYVKGDIRVTRNVLNVAKLSETQVYFRYESLDFIDSLFSVTFSSEQLSSLRKILNLINKINICFEKEAYSGIEVIRINNSKKAIYNLIKEKNAFHITFGRTSIHINRYIECSIIINNSYQSIKVESFEEAFNCIYQAFAVHVANYFNIDQSLVNDDYINLLEMVRH